VKYLKSKLGAAGFSHILVPLIIIVGIGLFGTYYLVLTHAATPSGVQLSEKVNGFCLDDYHSGSTSPSTVDIWKCNKTKAQSWTESSGANATKGGTITNANGLCLNVSGNSTANGATVNLLKCSGAKGQLWYVSGKLIKNPNSNKCLADYLSGTKDGTKVVVSVCSGSANQTWTAAAISTGGASGGTGSGGSTSSTGCAPAASATMTNTVSHKCGFPDTTNTGPSGTLYAVGSGPTSNTGSGWSVSGDTINVNSGGTLKNVDTGGRVVSVNGANATVNNVKIVAAATGVAGVGLRGANNAVIENSIIAGTNGSSGRMFAGIKDYESGSTYSANTVIKANNIYYTSTGVQVDHGMVEDNYIHNMGMISGDHINGTTSNGGGDGILLTLQHNTVFNQISQTDAISLFEDFAVQQNRVINDNLVAGGGYTIYGGQNSGGAAIKNIRITNNHFSKMFYSNYGSYGYIAAFTTGGTGNVWSGNVDDATGATIGQ
jgi:hypothetical protein